MTLHWTDRDFAVRSENSAGCSPLAADPAALRAWSALEASATLPTQSRDFVEAVVRNWLGSEHVALLVAGDGDDAAVLPLCRGNGHFARWRAVGSSEVYEPCDALVANRRGAEGLARAIAGQARPLSFDRIPAASSLLPALDAAMKHRALVVRRPAIPTPTIALDESWITPELRFNSRRRSDYRRAARKAEELGPVSYEVLSPEPHEFDAVFDEAIAVEDRGWKHAAGTALARDPVKEAFFRDYFRAAAAQGTLRIAFMRIGSRAAAMQMALAWQHRFWLFKIGFDEDFGKCSPGNMLMFHSIGWAARSGLESYEFLGEMEPWIADLWTQECRACVRLRTYPYNLRGMVAFGTDAVHWAARRLRVRT